MREVLWRLEPHVCRTCFGRIMSRPGERVGERVFRCSNCGTEASGSDAAVLCCCGVTMRKAARNGSRHGGTQVNAGIRCITNPEPSPLLPGEIVAMEVPA